ncbi:MAG: hypothetical protein Kapaf2KO_09540 [Candidatus Kapaibacteriales bacterium]
MRNIILILSIIGLTYTSYSQYGGFGLSDARTTGMGNTGNAYHHEALPMSRNPATLAMSPDTSFLRIVFPNIATRAISSIMPVEDFNTYFGGDDDGNPVFLSEQDKADILDVFGDTGELLFNFRANLLALTFQPNPEIGAFGFSVHDYAAGRASVDKDLADLLLNGNEREREYNFEETAYQLQYTRSYQLRYGRYIYHDGSKLLNSLYGGVALKYYQGFAHTNLTIGSGNLATDQYNRITGDVRGTINSAYSSGLGILDILSNNDDEEDFPAFPEAVGSGIGFDIGLAGQIGNLDVSLGITDIGAMSWDTNSEVTEFSLNPDLDGIYKNKRLDSLIDEGIISNSEEASFDSDLPTTLRVGFHYPIQTDGYGDIDLALDYNQGFNESAVNSTIPRVSVGAHWQPGQWIPSLLMGITNDRTGSVRLSTGIGYETPIVDIYLATNDIINAFAPSDFAAVAFTLAWKVF